MWTIVNDRLMEADTPVLPVESRAVSYGDGCFETLRSYAGRFLDWRAHAARLHGAMAYLGMPVTGLPEVDALREKTVHLLRKNDLVDKDAVVRLQVWREGGRGYNTDPAAAVSWAVQTGALPEFTDVVKLALVPTCRIPASAVDPRFKLSNGINYIRAAREAAAQGADDALMRTVDGWISETTIANIFWVEGNTIYTPSEACDLLPGITREILIRLIRDEGAFRLDSGAYTMAELAEAEAVWVCNSLREMVPAVAVGGRVFNPEHAVIRKLQNAFEEYKKRNLQ